MRTLKRLAMFLVIVAVVTTAFTGCEFLSAFLNALSSVNGTVIDARSATLDGISGVSVTLTNKQDPSIVLPTATTDADGTYTVQYDTDGTYEVSAVKSGWFFIPRTVTLGGLLQTLPRIIGIQLETATQLQDTSISFVLLWNSTYQDVDGHLTFPDGDGSGGPGSHTPLSWGTFDSPNEAWPSSAGIYAGFGPDNIAYRENVLPLGSTSSESSNTVGDVLLITDSRPAIQLDRDDRDGSGPEVITMRTIPFWPALSSSDFLITGDGTESGNYLPSSHNWAWIGVMEYYIDGWNATSSTDNTWESSGNLISSTDGSGADAVLYIVQGSNLLGKFVVPSFANIRTASIARINLFIGESTDSTVSELATYVQIVPDIQVVDGRAGILSSEPVSGSPVIGTYVTGR